MATWKKIIVSGSSAELNNIVVDNHVSASEFSGSFFGDGSGLTGITATALDIDNFGSDLTSITIAGTDKLALSDAGTEGRVNVSKLATPLAGTGLEASSGTIRIATAAAGTGLTGGGGSALEVDFTDATFQSQVSGAFTDTSASIASDIAGITTSFTISGSTGSDTFNSGETLIFTGGTSLTSAVTDNEITINVDAGGITETQLNTSVAGTGLSGGGGTALSVDVSDFMSNGADNRVLTATGTDGQNAEANLTFDGSTLTVTGNTTITGDLTVTGDTIEQQVTNLNVEDKFILLNSGSASGDAGFVVNGHGSAFGWNDTVNRWAFAYEGATWDQGSITSDAFAAAVVTSDDANYRYNGNIRIDGEDIYIYVE